MSRGWYSIVSALAGGEAAQDTFEYVIAIGVIVVAMFFVFFLGMPQIIQLGASATCPSVDTAPPTPTTCIIPSSATVTP